MKDLCEMNKYPYNLDVTEIFDIWEGHKHTDILTYRDQSFASIFTGTQSPIHHSNFMVALDDSLETFMNQTPDKVRQEGFRVDRGEPGRHERRGPLMKNKVATGQDEERSQGEEMLVNSKTVCMSFWKYGASPTV